MEISKHSGWWGMEGELDTMQKPEPVEYIAKVKFRRKYIALKKYTRKNAST